MTGVTDILRTIALSRNRKLTEFKFAANADEWFNYHAQVIIENWYFYLGYHNMFLTPFDGEPDEVFVRRVRNATVENHVKPIIDLFVSHLYGAPNSPRRYVTRNEESDEEIGKFFRERVQRPINSAYDDKKALNTLISGYTVVQRQLVDMRTNEPFGQGDSQAEKVKFGVIRKIPLDSQYCVPLPWTDENGYPDATRWGAVLCITEYDTHIGDKTTMDLLGRPRKEIQVIEYVDNRIWLKWMRTGKSEKLLPVTTSAGTQWQNKNPYGRVDVPFSLYRNTGDPFYLEGDSDVVPVKSLNMELNELGNGDKDTIRYHQYPILVGYMGAELPKDFVRTKDAHVSFSNLSKDAKLEYLVWNNNLEGSDRRSETIRRAMSQVTGASLMSRGFMRDIGQIRSGPPLKAMFTSDRATMHRKFAYFAKCEAEDMEADLRFFEENTGKSFNLDPSVEFHVEFEQDFLEIDRLLDEEIRSIRMASGADDPLEILKEVHPDWTIAQIKEAWARVQKSKESKSTVKPIRQSADKKGQQQTTE